MILVFKGDKLVDRSGGNAMRSKKPKSIILRVHGASDYNLDAIFSNVSRLLVQSGYIKSFTPEHVRQIVLNFQYDAVFPRVIVEIIDIIDTRSEREEYNLSEV
jgi:hypothetical protein